MTRVLGLNLRLIIEFGSAGNLAHINRASHYVLTLDREKHSEWTRPISNLPGDAPSGVAALRFYY